jgi:hypothetical protein
MPGMPERRHPLYEKEAAMHARMFLPTMAAAVLLAAGAADGRAAGALAVGSCGAYGSAYGFEHLGQARRSALARCGDSSCRTAATIRNQCAAFAVERHNLCGARGWAYASDRAQAEELAMQYCREHAVRDCRVRAWVCDDSG